jgi:hypothetical protein
VTRSLPGSLLLPARLAPDVIGGELWATTITVDRFDTEVVDVLPDVTESVAEADAARRRLEAFVLASAGEGAAPSGDHGMD